MGPAVKCFFVEESLPAVGNTVTFNELRKCGLFFNLPEFTLSSEDCSVKCVHFRFRTGYRVLSVLCGWMVLFPMGISAKVF